MKTLIGHNVRFLLVGLFFLLGVASQAVLSGEQSGSQLIALQSKQLASMLATRNVFLVNVHVPYEGELKDTDVFIPYDMIASNLDKLPTDRSTAIILYCRSGGMSEIAAIELSKLGYSQVAHLAGGMNQWQKDGLPIIHK